MRDDTPLSNFADPEGKGETYAERQAARAARGENAQGQPLSETDRDIERARRNGYSHLIVTMHTRRRGPLKGVTVRSSFGVCSAADAVKARDSLAQALDVVASTIYRVSDYTVVESSFETTGNFS